MPLLHHNFRRFLESFDELNPAQIEDAQTKIRVLRRKTEAILEVEVRANHKAKCPCCGNEQLQKWGRTRRKTNQTYLAKEKIHIVVGGLRGEESISVLCRREGIRGSENREPRPRAQLCHHSPDL